MLQVFSKGDVIVGAASVPISSLTRTRSQWISLFDNAQAKTGEVLLILRANDSGAQSPTFSAISERSKSSALERANSHSPTGRSSSDGFQRQQLHGLKHKLGRLSQHSSEAPSAAAVNQSSSAPASAAEEQTSRELQDSEAASEATCSPTEAHVPGVNVVSSAVDATKPHSSNEHGTLPDLSDTLAQQQDSSSRRSATHPSAAPQQQDKSSRSTSEGLGQWPLGKHPKHSSTHRAKQQAHVPLPLALLGAGISAAVAYLVGRSGQHYPAVQDGDAICTIGLCNQQHMQEFMAGAGAKLALDGHLSVGDRLQAQRT